MKMKKAQYDRGQLAALAVFRDLYDRKTDVYAVLAVFLDDIIQQKGLHSFSTNQINRLLKATYEFDIPDAVIHSALGKISNVTKANNLWTSGKTRDPEQNIKDKQDEILRSHDYIKDQLIRFVQEEIKRQLDEHEVGELLGAFSSFLLEDKAEDKFLTYITAFIITNEKTDGFRATLNQIREGVILYVGLKYNDNVNEVGTWRNNLTIFLETEVLFHLAGYNGEVCKKWFADLYRFIQEANTKAKKQLINLRYFPEVREEIDNFFYAAEMIVVEGQLNDPSNGYAVYYQWLQNRRRRNGKEGQVL
jgi:hypothetical protein